jgi:hypothetical protein
VREALQRWMLPISLIAIALLSASFIQVLTPHLKNVTIDDGVRRLEDVPFPFLRQTSAPVKEYHVAADIDYRAYQFAGFRLLPTLCLNSAEINGKPIARLRCRPSIAISSRGTMFIYRGGLTPQYLSRCIWTLRFQIQWQTPSIFSA